MGFPPRLKDPCHLKPGRRALKLWGVVRTFWRSLPSFPSLRPTPIPEVASDLWASVSSLSALAGREWQADVRGSQGWRLPQSTCSHMGLRESSVELWPDLSRLGPLSDLRAWLTPSYVSPPARGTGLSVHSVGGPPLTLAPKHTVLLLRASLCPLSSGPQPRPLQLQDLASHGSVLILIKVQTGLGGWCSGLG